MTAYYKKLRKSQLVIVIVVCLVSVNVIANEYSGGTGEPNNPYEIATVQDLIDLGNDPEDNDKHFVLTAYIDLDPNLPDRKVFETAAISSFAGVFDGNGYTISNLTINGESYLGLFGRLESSAEVKNLGVVNVNINGSGTFVGGLVGHNSGNIITSYCTGTVIGSEDIGGLVGWNHGSIMTSYSSCTVIGNKRIGGLVASNDSGFMSPRYSGITTSYSTGMVNGNEVVGGLVGVNYGSVMTSYSTSVVNGGNKIGGLVGYNSLGSIAMSYSTGEVVGDDHIGGLVGYNLIGIGEDPLIDRITSCFWDIKTSGQIISDGGTGLTTAEMHNINTYLSAGWDFADEIINGTCDYWSISLDDYPKLCCLTGDSSIILEGLGTVEEPYLIRNAMDLGTIWFEPLAHYRLEASIDLSGITWSMAVVPWFEGAFDGNGYVISNLNIQGSNFLGLFGYLNTDAKVSNLGLEGVDVNGTGYSVGSLVSENYGNVTMCYCTGLVHGIGSVGGLVGSNFGNISKSYSDSTISGYFTAGGLVGTNAFSGSITTSYGLGMVNGNEAVGGFVGNNWGSIAMSYSTSIVSGSKNIGGLVGMIYNGILIQCYSTGPISGSNHVGGVIGQMVYIPSSNIIIDGCFWDVETSGHATSAGGTGKTTAQMKDIQTFLGAGWDFMDETVNGTEDIWWIDEDQDYPRLWWENITSLPDDVSTESNLLGRWNVTSTGWVGGWPIDLEGTDISVIFEFREDTFVVTITESSTLLSETIGTYHTSDGLLYLTPTETQGSETNQDFLVPAISEYSISGDILTLTEVADDPVWYELERIY